MKALILLLFCWTWVQAQTEKVIVVQMDPTQAVSAKDSWQPKWDGARVETQLPLSHPLYKADTYLEKQPPLFNPECLDPVLESCFRPEMKLIFAQHTYVFGNHYGHILKFRNASAFTPGNKLVAQDFIFTETSLKAVNQLRDELFPKSYAAFFREQGIKQLVPATDIYNQHLAMADKAAQPAANTGSGTTTTSTATTTNTNTTGSGTNTTSTTATTTGTTTSTETGTTESATNEFDDFDLGLDDLDLDEDSGEGADNNAGTTAKDEADALKALDSMDINLDDDLGLDADDLDFGDDTEDDLDLDADFDLDFDF
jgi:hypothetical protein